MKKLISLFFLFIIICYNGCGLGKGPEGTSYRRMITVETNLPKLRIENIYLDSTTIYPYVLFDLTDTNDGIGFITIYPILDTGYINLKLYGGESQYEIKPTISLKDSLTVYTPIDTTGIFFNKFQFSK